MHCTDLLHGFERKTCNGILSCTDLHGNVQLDAELHSFAVHCTEGFAAIHDCYTKVCE